MFMEIIGIICEYNPFHNGHVYHINKIKELYPNSIIVLVMSGYFTERGDVSLISKYNKVEIALKYGVDLILELPVLYTLNSGDYFGEAAVRILNEAGVKKIVFGSECNDILKLKNAASMQINNNDFDELVKNYLKDGVNYPTALSKACGTNFDSNDLLGISYIKAILKNGYDIESISIQRTNNFNDTLSNENIISAKNIREKLSNGYDIKKYIPDYDNNYINKIDYDKLFELLKFKIITNDNLDTFLGVDEGLHNKLKKEVLNSSNLDDLINRIKSKRYTYVRIKRMLIHILLGIKKEDMNIENEYIKILGFNDKGKRYLKELSNNRLSYKFDNRIRQLELRAAYLYATLTKDESTKFDEYNKPIII